MPKDSKEGVERRLDNGLEPWLRGGLTVKGALFVAGVDGVSAGGDLSSEDDTPSTAAVTLTVSSEIENSSVALPS